MVKEDVLAAVSEDIEFTEILRECVISDYEKNGKKISVTFLF